MMRFGKWARVGVIFGVLLVYLVFLWRGLTEEARRSLTITKNSASNGDYVIINVNVTAIDMVRGLLHERILLIPVGRFAEDRATPAVDLKLLINSVSGKQSVVYPKGERIAPADFTTALSGNLNRYPFDRYVSDLDLLVTVPVPPAPVPPASRSPRTPRTPLPPLMPDASSAPLASPLSSTSPIVPASSDSVAADAIPADASSATDADPLATALVVGASDLNKSETVPIKENFVASIAGVKFTGQANEDKTSKVMRTSLVMRRASNVLFVSMAVMVLMFFLATSVMVMALRVAASASDINLLPLSLSVSLIFGLPALRNIQPGVPTIGALCDYISFIWAEFIVAASAVSLAWTWILRGIRDQRAREGRRVDEAADRSE
jgi:hypothetical protein